jgi:hypothetical protein
MDAHESPEKIASEREIPVHQLATLEEYGSTTEGSKTLEGRYRSTFRSSRTGDDRSPRFISIYHNALPGQQPVKNTLLAQKNKKA